ncbi:hypothetical protein JZ751_016719 [Albula glossodonta]|uniref:Uncharacterized protein n=1 Tax=Albula glossodonta TaxID=121402 RepID=A0A8T2P0Q5_9TELE|nr:hypothetical protein JZ751_016719 [Albula glossodonta]
MDVPPRQRVYCSEKTLLGGPFLCCCSHKTKQNSAIYCSQCPLGCSRCPGCCLQKKVGEVAEGERDEEGS